MKNLAFPAMLLVLTGCTTPVIKDRIVEIKTPVSVPCVRDSRPSEVQPLNKKIARQDWDALTTDQRENLILAQAAERKAYGDELYVATSGCP